MKTITHAIAAIAVAGLTLWSTPAVAGPRGEAGPHGEDREANRAEAHANMIEALDVNDEQKTQIEAIMAAKGEQRKELLDSVQDEGREARSEVREQMKTLREETNAELKTVLSEDQFSRLEELRAEKRADRPSGRRGGHAGRGR
jgi:Spy/CpxP family protein refolding chaperone